MKVARILGENVTLLHSMETKVTGKGKGQKKEGKKLTNVSFAFTHTYTLKN